jgi:Ser/Thr protein kinase RdoA (MazF antagonist)
VVAEVDLAAALERLIAGATAGLSEGELAAPTPADQLRFNPGDFAPHNLIFRPDGSVCAIDFEYFGAEEAAWLPAGFLAADQSLDLGAAQAEAFLAAYHANRDVPDAALARYGRARALFELIWLMVNVSLMTPAHVARKRFAGDFDLAAHLAERRSLVHRRLARAERVVGELAG